MSMNTAEANAFEDDIEIVKSMILDMIDKWGYQRIGPGLELFIASVGKIMDIIKLKRKNDQT